MSDLVSKITDKNFQTEVLESKIPVLVDFWADWCGPCLALAPILEQIADEHKDKIKVCKVNVEENPQLAAKFNIRNIPFLAFVKDGQKVAELVGNQPKKVILNQIEALHNSESH
ncbi:thioredoxin [Fluviispira multicolorata]|uniref:Thioredoxin n=1 Tax=Fluviispira multicolorata TaxID=2654512 RepID=A0A833JDG0_9BACT|nr:thioredoxin [Fluviispira multicolorata]KAB8031769.1 thioredoxin [Fluviispira multicolorata]